MTGHQLSLREGEEARMAGGALDDRETRQGGREGDEKGGRGGREGSRVDRTDGDREGETQGSNYRLWP
ncbi:hypothetical protein E2C01_027382 [Portunus trituberculatus]|uniref:Uncharacterized protein n=1 Tax=Portunus trituberculatus TaxID=210409 RepID=A0A5B7EHZ8_PORTR|nr:hypothetical protein [Portunus trituberculatus]